MINELNSYVELCEDATDDYSQGRYLAYKVSLKLAKKLDESQKPVVPKFVAEWFEERKGEALENNLFYEIVYLFSEPDKKFTDFQGWLYGHSSKCLSIIIRMKDGYEIEKEPLYYVKLPVAYLNHCDLETYLMKGDCGNITIADNNDFDDMKFTESEIKAIDERYWAFAVPVEEG